MSEEAESGSVTVAPDSSDGQLEAFASLLFFGDSGTGKTACAVRAAVDVGIDLDAQWEGGDPPQGDPDVYVVLTERQGLPSAKLTNPRLRKEGVVIVSTLADLQKEIALAVSGKLVERGFKRWVLDGLTEAQRLIVDDLMARVRADGRMKFEWDEWRELKERTRRLLRFIRSIPMNIVCTALEQQKEDEDGGESRIRSQFEGSVANEVMQYFSAVGRLRKIQNGSSVEHRVDFRLPNRYMVKGLGPINGQTRPCAAAMFEVLEGTRLASDVRLRVVDTPAPSSPPPATPELIPEAPKTRRPAVD